MSDRLQAFQDDIAYLREMADAGSNSGARGGGIILAAGLAFGAASVLQWAALSGFVSETVGALGWLVAMLAFVGALIWVKRSGGKARGGFRTVGLAWAAIGWTIFALFAAIAVSVWRTNDALILQFFPSVILALYGAAWSIGAGLVGRTWMKFTAGGSFLMCIVCAYFIANPVQYLVYAGALVLLAALPGVALIREEARFGAAV